MNVYVSSSEKTVFELITRIYSEEELYKIERLNYNFTQLNKNYPVECMRADDDVYRITYASEKKLLILTYFESGRRAFQKRVTTSGLKKDLKLIDVGDYLDEVRHADELGEYHFLYTGDIKTPKISTHYTKDSYLFTFFYNDSFEVIKIEYMLI